jgi:hypothetical protein
MSHYGNRFFRTIVTLLEWVLKKLVGPDRWRPAGAVRVLPPSAFVYDVTEEARAEPIVHTLAMLGFAPVKVPVDLSASDTGILRAMMVAAADCWATVLLEPLDAGRAGRIGPPFREYAHQHADVVAVVVGPLPSRAEILNRYRHVVTDDAGGVAAPELAAGLAHASAARVLHCARLLNTAVAVLTVVVAIAVVAIELTAWLTRR